MVVKRSKIRAAKGQNSRGGRKRSIATFSRGRSKLRVDLVRSPRTDKKAEPRTRKRVRVAS